MSDTLISKARTVAFQGEPGAYANLAAREALPQVAAMPRPTFEAAVDAARSGQTDLAIVPVENSTYGRIADVHQLMRFFGRAVKGFVPPEDEQGSLFILGEHFFRVRHQLLGPKGARLENVKTVFSQAPALGQCRRVIKELGLTDKQWGDTADAARHVAELNDPTVAAIASSLAGKIYGLDVLRPDIEDASNNMTRFLIVGREPDDPPNDGRPVITTVLFRVRNVPAALYKAMGGFATNGVNITKLESYQLGGSFNATEFYADIEGHPDAHNVRLALEELQFFSTKVTVVGIYPAHPYRNEMP
jgi:prephenate dehydratase